MKANLMQSFEIIPHRGALPIELGFDDRQVESILGQPNADSEFQGKREQFFTTCNVAYGVDHKVVHIGLLPEAHVKYGLHDAFTDAAFQQMLRDDGEPMIAFGIIYLLHLGITLSGFHDSDFSQKAITVFRQGEHDSLKVRMERFAGELPR